MVVGAGGAGTAYGTTPGQGGNSSFGGRVAYGGGHGGENDNFGADGGSGGGEGNTSHVGINNAHGVAGR